MSDEEVGATGELSMEELVQRELEALRAVDGVTSATAKGRSEKVGNYFFPEGHDAGSPPGPRLRSRQYPGPARPR